LIGVAPNTNAPAYVPVTQPKINIIDISSGNFEIQSNNSSATYLYALFGAPNLPNGVSYAQNRMKYCGTITSAQLNAGYDVIADIEAVFGNLAFPNKISIIIDPINQATGNRSQYVTEILNIDTPMIIEVRAVTTQSVSIPFGSGGTFNGSIDWGDGTITAFTAFNSPGVTHTYALDGDYNVLIFGTFTRFINGLTVWRSQFLNILQWGSNKFTRFSANDCDLLTSLDCVDTPQFGATINISSLFVSCTNLVNINNIEFWDVTLATSLASVFNGTKFNQDLSLWNVSNITSFSAMFQNTLFNQNIGGWDVSNALTLGNMFQGTPFNQNISGWDVSSCTNFNNMFRLNTAFNQNISGWNVSSGAIFNDMIRNSVLNTSFATWDIRNATNMATFGSGNTAWSVANWNATLIGWAALVNPPSGITISVKPVATGAGITAKNTLIATWGWTINENVN
jgi:hypothetical protein